MSKKPHILDFNLPEWENYITSIGEKKYRARQIYEWMHKQMVGDVALFSNIPESLRARLREDFVCGSAFLKKHIKSEDGTEKILLEFADGKCIETVYLRNGDRKTICVSTQGGCSLYCEFCMTGRGEFQGNLSSGEILEQIYTFGRLNPEERISNIVFMGMGEPLMNYDNTMKAAAMLNNNDGLHIGARRISVSTAGVLPGIKKFVENDEPFNLALSIHSFNPEIRAQLMNAEKKWHITDVIDYLAANQVWLKKSRITFEYVMISGLNMSESDAKEIARNAKRIRAKISLIPLNYEFDGYRRPGQDEINAFWEKIKRYDVEVFNRSSPGYDIQAACGMLKSESVKT